MSNVEDKEIMESYTGRMQSASSIITFKRCPREYWYNYVLKLKTPPSIHLVKGSIVHKILELFFKKYEENFMERSQRLFYQIWIEFKDDLEELKMTDEELTREKNDCMNMVHLYLQTLELKMSYLLVAEKVQNKRQAFYLMRPKFKEKYYKDIDLNIHGYVDRIHTDFDGTTTIGDYKTSKKYGIGIKDEYEIQSAIYALLYKRCEKKDADYTSIIFFRYGEEVRTRVTPSQIRFALDTVSTVNKATLSNKREDYPKCEGTFCKWCARSKLCSGLKALEDKETEAKAIAMIKKMKEEKK